MGWILCYYLILHGAGIWRYYREPRKILFLCLAEFPIFYGLLTNN